MKIYNHAFLVLFQFLSCNQSPEFPQAFLLLDNQQTPQANDAKQANLVFKSTDAGQTWNDISDGLPNPSPDDNGLGRDAFAADDNGVYFTSGRSIYHHKPGSAAPLWTKESFPDEQSSIAPGNTGIFAYNYWGGKIFQKTNRTGVWSPVFSNFEQKRIRSIFETAGGSIFISSDNGLFKSTDHGKSWKLLPEGGWGKMVESNGVLIATSQAGIVRSTDEGESWTLVISEGGVGIDVERVEGGFAAITYSTTSTTRRIRTSRDGGKTWQAIDAGLQKPGFIEPVLPPVHAAVRAQSLSDSSWHPKDNINTDLTTYITTIIQVGEIYLCGHTDGIYRSSDKGKTWKLVLRSQKGRMFRLSVSGNVVYGVQVENHC